MLFFLYFMRRVDTLNSVAECQYNSIWLFGTIHQKSPGVVIRACVYRLGVKEKIYLYMTAYYVKHARRDPKGIGFDPWRSRIFLYFTIFWRISKNGRSSDSTPWKTPARVFILFLRLLVVTGWPVQGRDCNYGCKRRLKMVLLYCHTNPPHLFFNPPGNHASSTVKCKKKANRIEKNKKAEQK